MSGVYSKITIREVSHVYDLNPFSEGGELVCESFVVSPRFFNSTNSSDASGPVQGRYDFFLTLRSRTMEISIILFVISPLN